MLSVVTSDLWAFRSEWFSLAHPILLLAYWDGETQGNFSWQKASFKIPLAQGKEGLS
jgi:hypothetical protein